MNKIAGFKKRLIGYTTPKNVEIYGKLKFNSNKAISSSEVIQTFPYDKLVTDPDGKKSFRYMVSPDGDDNNDGQSWDTPKKTIQSVIDDIPKNMIGHTAHIYVKPGNYPPFEVSNFLHGFFTLDWFGSNWLDDDNVWKTFARAGSTTVTTSNDQIIIEGNDSLPPVAFKMCSDDTHFEMWSRNPKYAPYQQGYGFWGRWTLTTTSTSFPFLYLQDRGESFILNVLFDMKGAKNFAYYVGSGVANLYSAEFKGGTGGASTNSGTWYGAMGIYSSSAVQLGSFGGGFGFDTNYPNPDSATLVFKDVKGGFSSAVFTTEKTRFEPQKMVYYDVSQTYGKTNLFLGTKFSGYLKYHQDYATIQDNSTYPRTIYEMKDGTKTVVLATGETTIDGTAIVDDLKITGSSSAPTCDSNSKGKIYYDTSSNHFYGCDGTNWKQLDN